MKILPALLVAALAAPVTPPGAGFVGRVAIIHDGNHHDADDVGAIAMSQAIVFRSDGQLELVHLEHSSHLGATTAAQHAGMIASAAPWESLAPAVTFDASAEGVAAAANLAAEVEASGPGDWLVIVQGGPWETMARAFDVADPGKHRCAVIVSHSGWNDAHAHYPEHRNREAFLAQYATGGKFEGFQPPSVRDIPDQNGYGMNANVSTWSAWLPGDFVGDFVFARLLAAGELGALAGDLSDAGMVFYVATGNATPSQQQIEDYFAD